MKKKAAPARKPGSSSPSKTKPRPKGDDAHLERWKKHDATETRHRAKADAARARKDLIEADLRAAGKRIDRYGDYAPSASPSKPRAPKIVRDN